MKINQNTLERYFYVAVAAKNLMEAAGGSLETVSEALEGLKAKYKNDKTVELVVKSYAEMNEQFFEKFTKDILGVCEIIRKKKSINHVLAIFELKVQDFTLSYYVNASRSSGEKDKKHAFSVFLLSNYMQ